MSTPQFTSTHVIRSLKAKYKTKRSSAEKIADWMTFTFGSMGFLFLNMFLFIFWVLLNIELINFIKPFDPFPFGLLTMIVSLEAIFLSIFVLISQNRAAKIDDLREEVDLQVDIITESELTKVMKLVTLLLQKNGVDVSKDKELELMFKPLDESKIEKSLEKQV